MKNKIKDLPLFLQIYIVISVITISISLIMMISLPHTLRSFFTEEMYNTITAAQSTFIQPENLNSLSNVDSDNIRTVKHILLLPDGSLSSQVNLPIGFVEDFKENAILQNQNSQRYIYTENDTNLFYIIRKVKIENRFLNLINQKDLYLISFLNDSYREDLVKTLFNKIFILSILISFISFLPAFFLAKYISKPLVDLESKVENLTKRQWLDPIYLDRKDEIGRLGDSVESLRLELLRQDNLQQNFLQNISHELKTPIMVIKSYSEAIRDGIYPGGNLDSSLDIITSESNRLEHKVKSLLYITKLDYMENFKLNKEKIDLQLLLDELLQKYISMAENLSITNNIEDLSIYGDKEQISIVFENILDNMLRYSNSQIIINNVDNIVEIFNDGPNIKEDILENIFNKFHKGYKGEVGLGLSIVEKILQLHRYNIYVENKENGVSFYIDFNEE